MKPGLPFSLKTRLHAAAFTLVEMLVVMAIIGIMTGLAMVAMPQILGANSIRASTSALSGTLEQARSYAMANNTYVFVGIQEITTGTVAVAVAASKDGTRGYLSSNVSGGTPTWSSTNLQMINKLSIYHNLHLVDLRTFTDGNMTRPTGATVIEVTTSPAATTLIPFSSPLGLAASIYQFTTVVIQFGPDGTAMVVTGNSPYAPAELEIGVQQSHGATVPALPTSTASIKASNGGVAVIQIDGITGSVRTYRP